MIKQVQNSLRVDDNILTLKLSNFLIFKMSLVIAPLPPSLSRIAYENRYVTHRLPNFNSFLFNRIKIVPIYVHEPSKPISLIKRRIEYLTKLLLPRVSKIIIFFLSFYWRKFHGDLRMIIFMKLSILDQ